MADSPRWFGRRRQPEPTPTPEPVPAAPVGPRGERTKTVAVRLTPDEHAAWVAAAEAEGRGQVGRWVRETVTARLEDRSATVPVAVTGEVRQMRAELARMGSNLNQIAKALNTSALGGGPGPAIDDVARDLEAARELLGSVRDELKGR